MSVDSEAVAQVLEELMSPATATPVDIPTFRSQPSEMTRKAAAARGVSMTEDEIHVVSEVLTHPIAIGTWNLIDPSQDGLEISGLRVAQPAFRYAVAMHTIMVLIGLFLLGSSLGASLTGSTQLAVAIGALGLGSFTALFFVAPLDDLRRSLGTRIQLEIVGLAHQRQMDLLRMYSRTTEESRHFGVDAAVLPRIALISERTLALIEGLGHPVAPDAQPAGALPLVMDPPTSFGNQISGYPLPGGKVLMDKAPMVESQPAFAPGGIAPDWQQRPEPNRTDGQVKIPIEPKQIIMDKAPATEAPWPADPSNAGDDET